MTDIVVRCTSCGTSENITSWGLCWRCAEIRRMKIDRWYEAWKTHVPPEHRGMLYWTSTFPPPEIRRAYIKGCLTIPHVTGGILKALEAGREVRVVSHDEEYAQALLEKLQRQDKKRRDR